MRLRDLGNTVIVVEHDEETIRVADHVVDIGPGAGEHGGEIVVVGHGQGRAEVEARRSPASTCRGSARSTVPELRREPGDAWLVVRGAREHNLKDIDVELPLGCFVAVTGVSGSGKSTLVNDILHPALMQKIYRSREVPGPAQDASRAPSTSTRSSTSTSRRSGARPVRTRRPTPACSTRSASCSPTTPEAKVRGYLPGRFSFNVKGGRCEACAGRRHDQDRDALPARRVRAVRGVQGRALQPRHARRHLEGQEHRRGARHAGRGGARASSRTSRRSPGSCRRSSTSASATCGSASRRRRCRAARRSG